VIKKLILIVVVVGLLNWLPMASAKTKGETKFSVGQIWAYKTRPQDAGSLIKIYRIETLEYGPKKMTVYHISMIGLSLSSGSRNEKIGHLPVSYDSLAQSVTKWTKTKADFPAAAEVDGGIKLWRDDEGGVFTISLAEIADVVQKSMPPRQ
jgi:hypothetical protein